MTRLITAGKKRAWIRLFMRACIGSSWTLNSSLMHAPPYSLAYSLRHNRLLPRDYLGYRSLGEEISIFNPKDYDSWQERADTEILRQSVREQKYFVFIKGCGIFAYHRELSKLMEVFDLIENSCKVLRLGDLMDYCYNDDPRLSV